MNGLKLKPLSVNEAWKGRRFKTDNYKRYEWVVFARLPKGVKIPEGEIELHFEFGFSSPLADNDNPVKPLQDILQAKYGFNDNRVVRTVIDKFRVPKGEEYIAFRILPAGDRSPQWDPETAQTERALA